MIKVILWDVDATLLDFKKSESLALKKTFAHFGLETCTDSITEQYSAINQRYWQRLERGELTKNQVLVGRFEEFFAVRGYDAPADRFCEMFESSLPDCVEYIGNAKAVIESLSKNYYQYAVTNGARAVQRKKLAISGIADIFDGVFISDEVGYEKPSVNFFKHVLANIPTVDSDEIIIVGDSLTSDIKGGNNIGIKTCLFNPLSLPLKDGYTVDYQIKSIEEIFDVVGFEE